MIVQMLMSHTLENVTFYLVPCGETEYQKAGPAQR